MATFTTPSADGRLFVQDAQVVVQGVRRALTDLLASVDADPRHPQDMSRRFGLDKTLTWKISRVIREPDPWDAVGHIPRRPSIQLIATALERHGAPTDRIESLLRSVDEFERFVETHSGDRETLEVMVSTGGRRSAAKRMEAFRKAAFQANSAIWGVRANLQISMHLMIPAPDDRLTLVTVTGFDGFRRLRPDVPWAVSTISAWDSSTAQTSMAIGRLFPLDPKAAEGGAPLLGEFCSDPMPDLRRVQLPDNKVRMEIGEGPVGNTAAARVLLGYTRPGEVSLHETHSGETGEHGLYLYTPVEAVVTDLLIHRSLDFAMNPTAHLYSALPGGPRYPGEGPNVGKIVTPERIVDLGCPPDLTTPEFPRYQDVAEFAARQAGLSLNDFNGYRYRLKYPPIPTLAIIRHGLAPRDSAK